MSYETMLRDIVRDQGEPKRFDATRVKLTDAQLSEAVKQYPDIYDQAADDIRESVILHLKDPANSFARWFHSAQEAMGVALVGACRERLTKRVRLDLKCMASDIEMEDATDKEFAEVHS